MEEQLFEAGYSSLGLSSYLLAVREEQSHGRPQQEASQPTPPPAPNPLATGLDDITLEDEAAAAAWLRMRERTKRLVAANASWMIPHRNKLIHVTAAEVAHFVRQDGVVHLTTLSGVQYRVDFTLDEVQAQVDPHRFFRANRQVLFARPSLLGFERCRDQRLLVHLTPTVAIPVLVPRARRKALEAWASHA